MKPPMTETPPEELAEQFVKENHLVCINGEFSSWNGSRWLRLNKTAVRGLVIRWATDRFKNLNQQLVNFIVEIARANLNRDETESQFWLEEPPENLKRLDANLIKATSEGFVDLKTGELHPSNRALFVTEALSIKSKLTEDCPMWLRFLADTFGDDRESIDCVQEFFGQCLTQDNGFGKLVMFVGESRAGKGVVSRVMQQVIGSTCAFSLESLGSNFAFAGFVDKTLAVDGDQRGFISPSTIGAILKLTGDDLISVNRKYRDAVDLRLGTKLLICSNNLINAKEPSAAFMNRLMIVPFRNSRVKLGLPMDGDLERNLIKTEQWPILQWAIRGYRRLKIRGHYVQPARGKIWLDETAENSQPIREFVESSCLVSPDYQVLKCQLLNRYNEWRYRLHMKNVCVATMTRELRACYGDQFLPIRKTVDGKRAQCYSGLAVV